MEKKRTPPSSPIYQLFVSLCAWNARYYIRLQLLLTVTKSSPSLLGCPHRKRDPNLKKQNKKTQLPMRKDQLVPQNKPVRFRPQTTTDHLTPHNNIIIIIIVIIIIKQPIYSTAYLTIHSRRWPTKGRITLLFSVQMERWTELSLQFCLKERNQVTKSSLNINRMQRIQAFWASMRPFSPWPFRI